MQSIWEVQCNGKRVAFVTDQSILVRSLKISYSAWPDLVIVQRHREVEITYNKDVTELFLLYPEQVYDEPTHL